MNNFKIVVDSSHDLSNEFIKSNDIKVVPFYIRLGNDDFLKDSIDIQREDLYKFMKDNPNIYPSTSLPSIDDFLKEYKQVLESGYDLLSIVVSSDLSGTYQSAKLAMDLLKEDFPNNKMFLIDSRSASLGLGLILEKAIEYQKENISIENIVNNLNKLTNDSEVIIVLDTLSYLLNGGRITRTKAIAGSFLNLKPIIKLKNGILKLKKSIRGKKRAIKYALKLLDEKIKDNPNDYDIFIVHGDSEHLALKLKEKIEKKYNIIIKHHPPLISATISCHIGNGGIGIGCLKKY